MFSKVARRFFSTAARKLEVVKHGDAEKGIITFEINNPETRNALSKGLIDDLQDAIHQVKSDEQARVVILKSKNPGMFCAGADLKERLTMSNWDTELFVTRLRETFDLIYHIPVPVIAAIDGPALGGGLELALSCDIRVCSKASLIGLTETSLGIIPGAGGTQKLSRVIGIAKAKELIFTAKRLKAEEALSLGIVNYVEEDYAKTNQKALEIAQQILPRGPIAIRAAKVGLNSSIETDLATGLNIEKMLYSKIVDTEDRIEGLKAFLEKRKPSYKGK
mmetsp:Transcript_46445/g.53852  ORF Transcript_46445/g.53852 Transcript_46445/m.53852 type:complete len:277 (-) Transcript_46445:134-964(-)